MAYAHKISVYELLQKSDSMLIVCEKASELFHDAGYFSKSADVLIIPVCYLCNQDSINKAKHFLDIYEHNSGFFDSNYTIEKGREIYYSSFALILQRK